MARLLLLNGPNLGLLGTREPGIYGTTTLTAIEDALKNRARSLGHELVAFQSDAEAELIRRVHVARDDQTALILFNPAAFTHTSIALRDALAGVAIPFIEIHISNVHKREEFRHHSYLSEIADGVIVGLGVMGYRLAVRAAVEKLGAAGKV